MQQVVSSTHVAPAILAALKLDLKFVKRIEIDFDVDKLAFCRVEFYPTLEQLEDVSQALETKMKSYALVEVSDETQNVEKCPR
jgi:hypothetical protein